MLYKYKSFAVAMNLLQYLQLRFWQKCYLEYNTYKLETNFLLF
jgi:hypothetical protein